MKEAFTAIAAAASATAMLSFPPMSVAQISVTTQQNDIGRTGQNLNETILNTSNVNPTEFGLLFAQPVAGPLYAQPLYLSGVTINGAVHNVVYAASLPGNVYAFDADSNSGANVNPLWQISLLDTAHGAPPGAVNYSTLGTVSTPVIDPASNTMYVVSTSYESGAPVFRLHALDVTTGAEMPGAPVQIALSAPGTAADAVGGVITLTTRNHNQRPALLLLNGVVYVSFGSYPEGEESTWHGWIVGYNEVTLAQTGVFLTTPNGNGGGVWMSGEGLAADQLDPVNSPYGRMFVATGNGDFTATTPYGANMDYGDSILDLDLTNGVMTVTDDFTPYTQAIEAATDGDQGSGGLMVVPTQAGPYPHLAVETGKSGTLFMVNRDNLGGYNLTTNQVVQAMTGEFPVKVLSSPAYWNGNVYYWTSADYLKSFALNNGSLSTTPTLSSEQYAFPGATPSISANGTTEGIVWSIDPDGVATGGPAILHAHDASNVATTLYSSNTNAARDQAGQAIHFVTPTVANGKVYVGTSNQLDVYGLLSDAPVATPTILPHSEFFTGTVTVTLADTTPNASIYYTTNNTSATTASTLYTGPFTVASSSRINAIAAVSGVGVSNQAGVNYSKLHTAPPVFGPAADAYSGPQSVAISDATPGAVIYYTTDGSAPTLGSTVYSGPITVSSNETINAVAQAPGYALSSTESAAYTIAGSSMVMIGDSAGFTSTAGFSFVGNSTVTNSSLQLSVPGKGSHANAVWYTTPLNVQAFTTDFYFQSTLPAGNGAAADGFTFTMQNAPAGVYALGSVAGGLGYQGLTSSVAVKFDVFDNAGEGTDSTGFFQGGAAPTVPALDMTTSGIVLLGPDMLHAHLNYDGTTLTLLLTDVVTGFSFTASSVIDIPSIVGGNTAYVGFTAGTHGLGLTQNILNWTYVAAAGTAGLATPTFSPGPGVYSSPQPVSIGDAAGGAAIYYTTDGSTPTTSSTLYSGPVTVSANETLSAIAVNGSATSVVATAAYQIAAPTPTFAPAGGLYSSPPSVTISDAVPGATIYYTIDGTAPNTSSAIYSNPIAISGTGTETIKAIAVANGYAPSGAGTAVYRSPAAAPTFLPAGGAYTSAQSVTISDASSGATIYYTQDGSTPTTSSAVYSVPITVSSNTTLKAVAASGGYAKGKVATALYAIHLATPTFTPAGGTYRGAQPVTISEATAGATIHYTTDGTVPTTSSAVYSTPVTVGANETLKAIAVESGYANSFVGTASYKIK